MTQIKTINEIKTILERIADSALIKKEREAKRHKEQEDLSAYFRHKLNSPDEAREFGTTSVPLGTTSVPIVCKSGMTYANALATQTKARILDFSFPDE
jgi:hypothetical protein